MAQVLVNPFQPFPVLATERFRLRPLGGADAEALFGYFSDPELTRYFGTAPFTSIEQAHGFIAQYEKAAEQGRAIRWGIAWKRSDALAGTCGFHNWSQQHLRAEIGYEVAPSLWRRGVMSEALPAICGFGFGPMRLNRIGALISLPNAASIRLVEKLGFQREGVLRQVLVTAGGAEDLLSYSLLRGERGG